MDSRHYRVVFSIIFAIMCGIFLFLAGCSTATDETGETADTGQQEQPGIHSLSVVQAYDLYRSTPEIIVIDVRTPDEYNNGHIKNAINLDLYDPDSFDELDTMDKDATYLVYCSAGSRSKTFAQTTLDKGFTAIYHMTVGVSEWEDAGYPYTK